MKPAAFNYHRARNVDDAIRLLHSLGEDAKILAGGQSLIPMMNYRLARPEHIIDIGGLRELDYIHSDADGLHIGALTTHHRVETAQELSSSFQVVRDAMSWVGHLPIRTLGTVGGSLAHADSTAEWNLLAVLLDARVLVRGLSGERWIAAEDFLLGLYTTLLGPEEMLVEILFPEPAPNAAITEYAERAGDFAIVAAGVRLGVQGRAGTGSRVVLGGVSPSPLRVKEAEEILNRAETYNEKVFMQVVHAAAAAVEQTAQETGEEMDSDRFYKASLARSLVNEALISAATSADDKEFRP